MVDPSEEVSHEDISQRVELHPPPRYVEWEPDAKLSVVPQHVLRAAGWQQVQRPVYRVSAGSYVDLETGEIVKKREMFQRRLPVPRNTGLHLVEQLGVVNSLGKYPRDLCVFLLRMRNGRGGFVMQLQDLVDSYIHRNGTVDRLTRARKTHAEWIGEIARAGILANMQTLGSKFQKHGDRSPRKVLEEAATWCGWPGVFRGKNGFSPGIPA
ncbi:hypothetical protein [Burkholderia plantarii]|uniref:hypothetical protein n=1 Tax=Burkholderia plantarii TaxID=41899 RepID=UPI0011DFD4E7|nr:hypothetical protein [Burkholderia plantarii]GLZ22645.1 hypothetical protein Bpla01_61740 [Burkholderia plantarii]